MFGISPWQLLIILVIVVLLFGTKKLRSLGTDLGSAVKGFKKAVDDKDADFDNKQVSEKASATVEEQLPSSTKEQQKES